MKKRLLMVMALLLVLGMGISTLLLNGSTANAASATTVFHYKGQTAQAVFLSTEGNIETSVYAIAFESVSRDATDKTSQHMAFIDVEQYNATTYEPIMLAYNQTATMDLKFSGQLDTVTLTATIPVTPRYFHPDTGWTEGTPMELSITMTWTGSGTLEHQISTWHYHTPITTINQHSNGDFRESTAVSGSVIGGTINFTPLPGQGDLQSVKNGSVEITH